MSKMRLFSVGPVNMFEYTLKTASKQVPYFRTGEFSEVVFNVERNLKKLMKAGDNAHLALLTASGSGGMEAVVQTLSKDKKCLVINGGSFGERFDQLLTLHNIPHDTIKLEFDSDLTAEILAGYEGNQYQALLINIHETSIGKYYDPTLVKRFCQKNGCYLIVDAISSFLADEYDMAEWGVDVTIISSQKALALDAGLSAVLVGDKYFLDRIKDKPVVCSYIDLATHIKDGLRGQTPFTPALSIIYQLDERLQVIAANGGAASEINRSRALAEYFRERVIKIGFNLPKYMMSNCLTPIICKNNNATKLFEICKNKYNIYLTPSGGENKERLLRVGHLGDLTIGDYDKLLDILKEENI